MILVSEIGDKTFFIACIMSMRYNRLTVYVGALSALAVMTILSALLGLVVPNLISARLTKALSACLFFVFGAKILYEEFCVTETDEAEDEMGEAAAAVHEMESRDYRVPSLLSRCKALWCGPVIVEAFSLTFLAEWGDRSQIATIALAAARDPYAVTIGGILGHAICTGAAVLGGSIISERVSMRTVSVIGGSLFLLFSFLTVLELEVGE